MKKLVPKGKNVVKGIDISRYQRSVDFKKVKKSGRQFAFIKATEGTGYKDASFQSHKAQAKAAGVLVGPYHFFHFELDPILQAKHFCATAGKDCELPHVLDVEWQGKKIHGTLGADGAAAALKCLAEIERISGRTPIVYTSAAFFIGAPKPQLFAKYPLWIASYRQDAAMIPSDAWATWKFWQYTDHEAVDGVGKIDADYFNGSVEDLHRFCGLTPPATGKIMGMVAEAEEVDAGHETSAVLASDEHQNAMDTAAEMQSFMVHEDAPSDAEGEKSTTEPETQIHDPQAHVDALKDQPILDGESSHIPSELGGEEEGEDHGEEHAEDHEEESETLGEEGESESHPDAPKKAPKKVVKKVKSKHKKAHK